MVKADRSWTETRCWGEGTGSLSRLLWCERGSLLDGAARCWIEPSVSLHWWDAADLRLPVPVCSSAHIVGDTQDSPVSKGTGLWVQEAGGKTALSQDLGVVYLKPFNPPAPPPPPPAVTLQQLQRRRAPAAASASWHPCRLCHWPGNLHLGRIQMGEGVHLDLLPYHWSQGGGVLNYTHIPNLSSILTWYYPEHSLLFRRYF